MQEFGEPMFSDKRDSMIVHYLKKIEVKMSASSQAEQNSSVFQAHPVRINDNQNSIL